MKEKQQTSSVGILLSTFEPNKKLAHWTAQQIGRHWNHHPPLFFSGLADEHPQNIIFKGDPTDWMELTLQAVVAMRRRGFQYVYLILDDHPPVEICHQKFLNQQLPELAEKLHAAYIGLLGYGQHRSSRGALLSSKEAFLEHCRADDRWKFSLHPGLWNLEKLQLLLKRRMELYSKDERTVWNFERHRDDVNDPMIGGLLRSCYRINGKYFLQKKYPMKQQLLAEKIERFFVDVMLYGAKIIGGASLREKIERELLWLYGHYLGPYPIFWSGTMQKGKPHRGFEKWLHRRKNKKLRLLWERFKREVKD